MDTKLLYNRIKAVQLIDRLDSEFYAKELLENEEKLGRFKELRLCELVDSFKKNNISDLTSNGSFEFLRGIGFNDNSGIPFIRTQNVMDGYVDDSDMIFVDIECATMVAKSLCEAGDLIVCRKGKVGSASTLPEHLNGAAISENVTRFSLKSNDDGDFFSVFLNSMQGRKRFLREATGVIQKWINNEKLREIKIIRLDHKAETYIGDKVRQAERLRSWAKGLEKLLDSFISVYQPQQISSSKLFSNVSTELLTDMLTATTYREHYINNQTNLRSKGKTVSIFEFLKSVTNGFDERNEIENGMPYVKVGNVKPGYIDIRQAPKIRWSALDDASQKQKSDVGDLLLTRKGSFGIAAVVMEPEKFLCSSEVFSCKPKKIEFMPILSWFLNSSAGNMQFWQFSTGTTMPGINQENLANILIPDFSTIDIEIFNKLHHQRFIAKKYATQLTEVAKLFVEALIEGQIDEQTLISAQEQLQTGKHDLDRVLLSRLKTDGIDGSGQSLFSDIDELYRLLALAQEGA